MRVGDVVKIRVTAYDRIVYARIDAIFQRCKACMWLKGHVASVGPPCPHEWCYDEFEFHCCNRNKFSRTWRLTGEQFTLIRNVTVDMCARKIYAFWVRRVTAAVLTEHHLPSDIVRVILSHVSKIRDPREHVWLHGLDVSAYPSFT